MTISHGAREGTLPKVWILLLSVFILTGLAACSQKPKPEKNTLFTGLENGFYFLGDGLRDSLDVRKD